MITGIGTREVFHESQIPVILIKEFFQAELTNDVLLYYFILLITEALVFHCA